MASKVPQGKRRARELRKGSAERVLQVLRELGPQPELADAIEASYRRRHEGFEDIDGGHPKRRPSTRT